MLLRMTCISPIVSPSRQTFNEAGAMLLRMTGLQLETAALAWGLQ